MPTLPGSLDVAELGGTKQNLAPVADNATDLDAAIWNTVVAAIAGMSRTSVRAWARFTVGVSGAAPGSIAHDAVWGNATAPTIAVSSTGILTVTWPASVVDLAGGTQAPNLRAAWANARGSALQIAAEPTLPNVVTLNLRTAAGVLDAGVGTVVDVFAI